MKSLDKLEIINNKIKNLNDNVLCSKKWKFAFVNRGVNNYCITINLGKKELFNGEFATYGSVTSALSLLEYMFSKELDSLDKKAKGEK